MGFEHSGSRIARRRPHGIGRVLVLSSVALAVVAIGPAATASAVERVIAGPQPTTYLNPEVEIDVGEELRLLQTDLTAPHDVTSTDNRPNGQALFRSETVGAITDVPVVGAESLSPGSYEFFCTVHPFMEGTLVVRGEGGDGDGSDRKAPSLTLRARDQRIADVLEAGKLKLKAKVDEPAKLRLRATPKRGKPTVARARKSLEPGTNRVAAKLTAKGKRLLRKTDRVKLKLTGRAEDAAGNSRKVIETLVLR